MIEVEHARKRALKQITNADHDNSVTALLPVIEEREEVPHVEFVVDDMPPCFHNESQNIHPMLSRYQDGPASDAYMSYACLMAIVQDRTRTVEFLQRVGVLAKFQTCRKCGEEMIRAYSNSHKWHWMRNRRKNGVPCKVNFSMKSGTFLDNACLSLPTFLVIFWHFVHCLSQKQAKKYLDIGHHNKTISTQYRHWREVCNAWIYKNWIPLGGEGKVCEIDKSYFAGQQKYGRRRPATGTWVFPWVFGIVCRGSLPIWLERVPEKTRDYLVPIMEKRVKPGTEIHSDKWKAYGKLKEHLHCSAHFTVNHKYNYANPWTGAHTQTIESSWKHCKISLPDLGLK